MTFLLYIHQTEEEDEEDKKTGKHSREGIWHDAYIEHRLKLAQT